MLSMPELTLIRRLSIVLAVTLPTAGAFAQAEPPPPPPPPAAETSQPPLVQLDATADHVVAPPPPPAQPQLATQAPPRFAAEEIEQPLLPCRNDAEPSRCEQPHDAYRHDGFYFRLNGETGYFGVLGRGPDGKSSLEGLGSTGQFSIGGTVWEGVVIAGTIGTTTMRADFHGRPSEAEDRASVVLVNLGALIDWYPEPTGGWHVGAGIGVEALTLSSGGGTDSAGVSYGARIFGGYDWWIGPQWSLGVMAILAATPSTPMIANGGDENGYRYHTITAGLAYALTLH